MVTSQAVEITDIRALTVDDENLQLDIRVQYSPLEFSIKDLELKGNPVLASAFILNSTCDSGNAQTRTVSVSTMLSHFSKIFGRR